MVVDFGVLSLALTILLALGVSSIASCLLVTFLPGLGYGVIGCEARFRLLRTFVSLLLGVLRCQTRCP